jgi:hypothetical protein
MARPLTGSVYPVKGGYGIRWLENGRRRRRCPSPPFPSKTAARRWFRADVLPRREAAGPAAPSADVTFEDYCERFLERQTTAPSTFATLRDRLRSARQTFGRWTLAQLEYAAADIAAWRAGRCPKAQGSGTPRRCGNASPQPSAGATWIATPPSTPAPTPSRAPGKSTRLTPTSSPQSTRSSTSPTASSSPPPEKPGCAPRNGVR